MSPEQESHLALILEQSAQAICKKYRAGQKEHGGDLFHKKGIIDMAIEEAVDQVIYLLTLKRQIEESGVQLGTLQDQR